MACSTHIPVDTVDAYGNLLRTDCRECGMSIVEEELCAECGLALAECLETRAVEIVPAAPKKRGRKAVSAAE